MPTRPRPLAQGSPPCRGHRPWGRVWPWLLAVILLLTLILGLTLGPGQPSLAQGTLALPMAEVGELPSAPVVLDGRPLITVGGSNQVTAPERANALSQTLTELSDRQEILEVTWELRQGLPVILVNQGYLMTVTQGDAVLAGGTDPEVLAAQWVALLTRELDAAQVERSQAVVNRRLGWAIAALLVAAALHWSLGWAWKRFVRPTVDQLTTQSSAPDLGLTIPPGLHLLLNLFLFLVRGGMWLGVGLYITDLFPFTRRWSYFFRRQVWSSLTSPNLRLGQRDFSLVNLLLLLSLLLGLVVLAGVFTNFLRSRVLYLAGLNRGSREAIAILTKYTLIFLGTVILLQLWGLDLSSLALIASALGVGVGLGLQNIAKDFGSGIVLVFERPIQVGDFVEFGTYQGTVERIGARSTEIRTLDQVSIIVPNSRFLEQEVINWSHGNPVSRIRIPVGVSYESDPSQVRDILLSVCRHHPQVMSLPAPQVFFRGFGESSLDFDLLVWISEPHQQMRIKSDLYFSIEVGLRECNIEIPFPQRDVHIRSSQVPFPGSLPPHG